MAQLISVKLSRFDGSPWGFRLQGGKDFGTPLIVQKVNGGSPAEQAGLRAGDAVIRVNTTDMFNLRHKDAQDVIVRSGNSFEMTVQRGGSTWRPSVSPVSASLPSPQPSAPASCVSPVTKTSLAAKKQDTPLIGSGHNFTPKPFLNGSSEGSIKSIVNKQYNSPVGIYSEETIAETLSAQAEVLAGGVLGVNFKKNERNYNAENSEVFKMVQEADKEPKTPEPAEPAPHSGVVTPSSPALAGLRSVTAPETKPQPTTPQTSLPPGQNICADCERLIVGVFVRIKDKNLHVECFKCSTCGTSLKNVGYYNINNKLYCDIHAKLVARQHAPAGFTPVTVPPGGKAPAGTISAALTSLGGGAPLSPPLNSHGSPQPYAARNERRTSNDLGSPMTSRRSSCTEQTYYNSTTNVRANGREATTTRSNGTALYDECDSRVDKREDGCNARTYTSTITFRTGNEVGPLADNVDEIHPDNNRDTTNEKLHVTRDPKSFVVSSSLCSPKFTRISSLNGGFNDAKRTRSIAHLTRTFANANFVNSDDVNDAIDHRANEQRNANNSCDRVQEPPVVNTYGFPRYHVTNNRLKTGTFTSYKPGKENSYYSTYGTLHERRDRDDRTSRLSRHNVKDTDSSIVDDDRYRTIDRCADAYDISCKERNGKIHDNGTFDGSGHGNDRENCRNDDNGVDEKNDRIIPGYRTIADNGHTIVRDLNDSLCSLTESRSSKSSSPSSSPLSSSLTTITTTVSLSPSSLNTAKLPNRIGTSPVDTPTFRAVQSHTANNISGPKPFGGTSITAPSNFTSAPLQNSGSNTLPRPQSQTVTARYYEESDYYESIEAPANESVAAEEHYRQKRESASIKSKSLVWPPVKPIEDITYPTASPIWIDPNPVLEKRPRHNVRDKRVSLQEASDSRCGSRCGSRCSRNEEREYERYSIASSTCLLDNYREPSMDRASCAQPFYRKVEVSASRRECRGSAHPPRASSTESVRRSLTPTRINQPIPKPWVATVTAGTCFYGHVEPPPQPETEIVCTRTCRCKIICERTSGPQGPDHEQQHTYREESCEVCRPTPPAPETCQQDVCRYSAAPEPEVPQEVARESDNEVVDLSKVVPPDVAVCPKGVESQHNLFTETMEKDVGDIHIKKTTIYEKTVELMSPERAGSPETEETPATESLEPSRITSGQETYRTSSTTLDREVETISDRKTTVDSTEVLTSAIGTAQLMEDARKEEEAKREEYERVCREEKERLRRVEQECQEQQRRYDEEKAHRKERKRVAFGGQRTCETVQESYTPQECYHREEYVREEDTGETPQEIDEERYRELKEEIRVQEDFQQLEEQRRQSLREQVEVHQCMREQQQQQSEKRQSLQERRLCARFRDTTTERQAREQQYQEQQSYQQPAEPTETCQRKHVQFVTEKETGTRPLPPSTIKNATAKEWKSEMVRALTTAPARPYSPFDSCQRAEEGESTSRRVYSKEVRYEEKRAPCPPATAPQPRYEPTERPVSPFQDALMTAPERPYTPLGRENGEGYDNVICVDRSQTPIDWTTNEGYCHPAEILYTDDKTREARSRERNLKRVEGPRPLPTPPPDHRLRDTSVSPARSSRPGTPKDRSLMTGLKKPDTIPSYQKYLVSMQHDPIDAQPYVSSRSPTPNRTKSPAPGPPEPPACYVKAQAPRIRESPPVCKRTTATSCHQQTCSVPMPERSECVSYHLEEDTPSGHRAQAYHGARRSCYDTNDTRSEEIERVCEMQRSEKYERREEQSTVALQPQREHEDKPSCSIGKVNRMQPSLACPLAHCSGSERFPKTGVRVLPPCAPPVSCGQSYETRRVCHQERTTTSSSSSTTCASQRTTESNCPNSGVTIMPCKTTSRSGTKAGIVVVPCDNDDNASCSRAGICVTPTSDRSGVCVSPIAHGKSAIVCSKSSGGPRSGGTTIDIGNCPGSGIRVAACDDGSISVGPCSIPGYSSVKCPKPILKSTCSNASLPYPQIPMPNETDQADPCDACPMKKQPACQPEPGYSSCTIKEQSFQPIPERRTNLSNQLTQLTIKRDKQQVVQLFKPQAQSQTRCLITDTVCQTKTEYGGSQNPGPNFNTRRNVDPPNLSSQPDLGSGIGGTGTGGRGGKFAGSSAPKRGRGILNQAGGPGSRQPLCGHCNSYVSVFFDVRAPTNNSRCTFSTANGERTNSLKIDQALQPICCSCNKEITRGPFITALGQIWCPEHFVCVNSQCRRALQDIGFVEEKGQLHCEYCFERFIAPGCNKCNNKIKGDCLNAVGKHFHPECFNCSYCGKLFGNSPFFLEDGLPYCEADWNELFTTKCYACGFPVEAGDRWVEALNNNYHSQCFNCTMCKKNLEGQSFYAKGGRPFCKNHAR